MPSNPRSVGPSAPLIFVDTCVWLDHLTNEQQPTAEGFPRSWVAQRVVAAIAEGRVRVALNTLVAAEILCTRRHNGSVETHVRRTLMEELLAHPSTALVEVDYILSQEAGEFSSRLNLKPNDAIHMATAVKLDCDYLMTADTAFPTGTSVDGVKIVLPTIVWNATIDDQYVP